MKHLPILLTIVCLALAGCEQPINEQEQNQPVNPATFSLVGKKYVCDRSDDNPYNEHYFMEVIDFFSTDSAVWYGTTHRDLSPMEDYYNQCKYKLKYPNLTLMFGEDPTYLVFQDANTLYCKGWEHTYTILK